jgi:hypothetical protein
METKQDIVEWLVSCWRNKGRIKKFLDSNENDNTTYKTEPLGYRKSSAKGQVYNYEHKHLKRELK